MNSGTMPAGEQSESLLCVRSGQSRTAAASLRVCLLKPNKEDMPENTEDSVCDPSPDTGLVKKMSEMCFSCRCLLTDQEELLWAADECAVNQRPLMVVGHLQLAFHKSRGRT